eukprot:SAG22_NODE_77_length_22125_cov_46.140016_12_plen_117_part_00
MRQLGAAGGQVAGWCSKQRAGCEWTVTREWPAFSLGDSPATHQRRMYDSLCSGMTALVHSRRCCSPRLGSAGKSPAAAVRKVSRSDRPGWTTLCVCVCVCARKKVTARHKTTASKP